MSRKNETRSNAGIARKISAFVLAMLIVAACLVAGCASTASSSSTPSKSPAATSTSSQSSSSKSEQVIAAATEQDKADLQAAIDEAKAIDVTNYTADTTNKLTSAIGSAEKVNAKSGAAATEVKVAISEIKSAISALKEKDKPVVLTGTGDDVVDIPANLSTCLVTADYNSGSNFVISSLDSSGNSADLLVNTIGAYSGTTTTLGGWKTAAFLEVKASGPWTITLKPLADADVITSGQPMSGDNVVLAGTGSATKLNITNNGERNFIVEGVKNNQMRLLVNEIGSYSGTVVNNGFTMFVVKSSGEWTISW